MIASKRYLTQLRRASLKRRRRSARNSIWIRSNAVHGRHVAKARSASRTDRRGQMSADSSGEKQILLLNATLIYVNRTASVCVPFHNWQAAGSISARRHTPRWKHFRNRSKSTAQTMAKMSLSDVQALVNAQQADSLAANALEIVAQTAHDGNGTSAAIPRPPSAGCAIGRARPAARPA